MAEISALERYEVQIGPVSRRIGEPWKFVRFAQGCLSESIEPPATEDRKVAMHSCAALPLTFFWSAGSIDKAVANSPPLHRCRSAESPPVNACRVFEQHGLDKLLVARDDRAHTRFEDQHDPGGSRSLTTASDALGKSTTQLWRPPTAGDASRGPRRTACCPFPPLLHHPLRLRFSRHHSYSMPPASTKRRKPRARAISGQERG